MNQTEFKERTKKFAIDIGRFCKTIPFDPITKWYIGQLIRASSSVGANYRAACRAKSKADFINKLRIVQEECDESLYFLELLASFHAEYKEEIRKLYREGNEILAMVVSSINTAIKNKSAI